jgi:hypothetical protein
MPPDPVVCPPPPALVVVPDPPCPESVVEIVSPDVDAVLDVLLVDVALSVLITQPTSELVHATATSARRRHCASNLRCVFMVVPFSSRYCSSGVRRQCPRATRPCLGTGRGEID